ncbi:glycosyltransferase family 2 protein [Herbiconiux sp. VKM Ac-2851]|uniref:glycosyltransferase family 2 protein n=1 Tax=Herbiconiux sp. VKM Ac-2851 TaxID=2739025 RepID=UPI001563B392|nr:glycosyltransferase [Herbiconiux sp. VKM Ac-2851]
MVVTVATYKRPALLGELLASLAAISDESPFSIIVIDNDPDGSGEAAVVSSGLSVSYSVEPTPGIVAARNAALEQVRDDTTDIVFVDDDETVPRGWLVELLRVRDLYGAEIVCGPVESVFPEGSPSWIEKGGYIQRSNETEGLTDRAPATNNTLVSMAPIRALGLRFDQSFSETGGSDTHFFRSLTRSGVSVAWAPGAAVSEVVPINRLTFRWVMRRYIRINNVSGRLMLDDISRAHLAFKAVLSIAYGIPRTLFALIRGKGLRLADTRYITRGIGWLGAASDRLVREYRRTTPS